jgi:hypothetical protein
MASFLSSVFTPIYAAVLGGIAGYFLKWLTERATRDYERETKRLQFFKAFYELQSLEKVAVNPEFDRRCQQRLRDASRWMASRPTKGDILAKQLALVGSLVSCFVFLNYNMTHPLKGPELWSAQVLMLLDYLGALIFIAVVVYKLILPFATLLMGLLARRFQHLKEAEW